MKAESCRLHAPRADFARPVTPAGLKFMQAHGAYLRGSAAKLRAVAFGPVWNPPGAWGMALWELPDDVAIAALCAEDPAIKSGLGFRHGFARHRCS